MPCSRIAANSRAAYSLACQCVFAQHVTFSASLLGENCGASSLILSGNIQGSGKVSFAVPFRCERLNNLHALLSVQLDFQVCGGNSAFHSDLRRFFGIR